MNKILIIEDSEIIRSELSKFLSRYGYEIDAPNDFNDIIKYIKKSNPDLILLDLNLPVFDGYYICREIRKSSMVPIIVVTSRDSEIDELMSINLGADDFITKPYNTQILLARISSILKRVNINENSDILTYNNLKLNLLNGTISNNNLSEQLTKNEIKILSFLIKNKGTIVSRETLMEFLWNSNLFIDDNTLSVNITRLRKTLSNIEAEEVIQTRRGMGYILP